MSKKGPVIGALLLYHLVSGRTSIVVVFMSFLAASLA
jgi:hypothetical protein